MGDCYDINAVVEQWVKRSLLKSLESELGFFGPLKGPTATDKLSSLKVDGARCPSLDDKHVQMPYARLMVGDDCDTLKCPT